MTRCPKCGTPDLAECLSEDAVRFETILRAQFIFDRVEKMPRPAERKDLTSFAHSASASLVECTRCDILIRREGASEPTRTYVEDEYDDGVMSSLLPRYQAAFRAREVPYRSLVRNRAGILEIGPHLGAFLDVAREWGWNAAGVDIGKDTTRFITSRGHTIYNQPVEECRFPDEAFDGVFVWNCFEQIPDPRSMLEEAHRILKPAGVLVLRTPNALFYKACQFGLRTAPDSDLSVWIVRALGYNNLLAFPYLYGYDDRALTGLAGEHGFRCDAGLNSELITLPYPQLAERIVEENRATHALVRQWSAFDGLEREGRLTGPWMEMIFRRD